MCQLKFDNNFCNLIRDITYWRNQDDIPDHIKKFIINTSNMRVIYEKSTGKYYCGKCTEELDSNNYCKKCDIRHKKYTIDDVENHCIDIKIVDKKMVSRLDDLADVRSYLIFDIIDENVVLYFIKEKITYYNPLSLLPYKSSHIYIDTSNSYYIEKNGVTNLETNMFIPFSLIDRCRRKLATDDKNFVDSEESSKIINKALELSDDRYFSYLYTDNLDDLKHTIYRYSKIWELKDYLKQQHIFNTEQFTINPLYYPSFEYLVNYKLYNLAWEIPNWFTNGKNFKEIFGVDKKYLSFMSENNITIEEFIILQFYPTTDIELLRFFSKYSWDIEKFQNTNIDLKKLKKCLEKNNLSSDYISDYLDYFSMAKELKLNLEDKKILYPDNLIEAHDELYNQIEVVNDPVINEEIKKLSSILTLNRYEDDNYVIYPASSIEELVGESRQQKNCVRTYCERVSNNESQIYFMRKKTELEKSLVTIEVRDKHIVQARVKYNKLPSDELNCILRKWESNLIPITND